MVGQSGRALAAVCLILAAAGGVPAADAPGEYEVKAAFLFHFARLTEWPPAAARPGDPFVVAILGDDPFGPALDRMLAGQTVQGRPLQVQRAATLEELTERPQILFISPGHRAGIGPALKRFKDQPVLTVSEVDGFGAQGGIVNFVVTAEGRVRFEINVREADGKGLKMSSEVLKLARIVGPPRQ